MLQIISSTNAKNLRLEIDDYVPLSFSCEDFASTQPLYWRTGDFNKSLIEIGVNEYSGAISSVTVTLIDPLTAFAIDDSVDIEHKVHGVPVCEISDWSNDRFRDEPSDFLTFVGSDKVLIWLTAKSPLAIVYEAGDLGFGVNPDGFLSLLEFRTINKNDIHRILQISSREGIS